MGGGSVIEKQASAQVADYMYQHRKKGKVTNYKHGRKVGGGSVMEKQASVKVADS